MSTTLDLLNDSFGGEYKQHSTDGYFALLFAYRRLIVKKLKDEERIAALVNLNNEQTKMIQEFVLKHPSYETEITEDDWNVKNKKYTAPFKE